MVRNGLRGEGVDVRWLSDDPDAPTGALARDRRSLPPAEVVYLRRGSAASRLEPADVEAAGETIEGAQWLHLTGITPALSPSCRAAVQERAAVRTAPAACASRSTSTCAAASGATRRPPRC